MMNRFFWKEGAEMRLFISMDYEGIWGVPSWNFMKTDEGKKLLHKELNVLLGAISDIDKNAYVLLSDGHSHGENISLTMLELGSLKFELISGYPRPNYMMAGIDSTFDGAFFVGYHTKIGGWGAMDHSYSPNIIYRVLINGKEVGESTINGMLAHYYNVPVVLVSGSEELEDEVKESLPEAVFHATNKTLSRFSTQSLHGAVTALPEKVHQALQKLQNPKDLLISKPVGTTFTLDLIDRLQADIASELPFVNRIGPRTIEFHFDDYSTAFHAFLSIISIANYAIGIGG